MSFWTIAAPIIGAVIGAAGQVSAAKKQAKAAAQASNAMRLDLGYLRKEAEENGFNPLTVLQATGGAGSHGQVQPISPGFLSFLAGQAPAMGQAIGGALSPQTKADLDLTKSQTALNNQMVLESQQRPQDVSVAHGNRAEDDYLAAYAADPGGYTLMRSMSGAPIEVRNDILHRLQLEPGSLYGVAEDSEMVFGEIGSEITGIGNIGDAGLFGDNVVVRKVEQVNNAPAVIGQSTLPSADDSWLTPIYDWLQNDVPSESRRGRNLGRVN